MVYEYKKKFLFIVPQKAAVKRGSKYLIMKRAANSRIRPGYWDFPGGKLECREKSAESVEREIYEETGLKSKATKPVFAFTELIDGTGHIVIIYECRAKGKVKLSNEHSEFVWATKEKILKMKAEPFIKAFLRSK